MWMLHIYIKRTDWLWWAAATYPQKSNLVWLPQPCITPFQTCHLFISVFFGFTQQSLVELGPCMLGLGGLITLEQYSFWDRCIDIYDNCKIMWECKIFTFAPSSQFRQLGPFFLDVFGLWFGFWFGRVLSLLSIKVHYFLCLTKSTLTCCPLHLFHLPNNNNINKQIYQTTTTQHLQHLDLHLQ